MKKIFTLLAFSALLATVACKSDKTTTDTDNDATGETNAPVELTKTVAPNGDTLFQDPEGQLVKTVTKTGQVISYAKSTDDQPIIGPEQSYYVTGVIENGAGGEVILDKVSVGKITPLISQAANREGEFGVGGTCNTPQLMQLRIPGGNIHFIVFPGDTISFKWELQDPGNYIVEGNIESTQLRDMYEILNEANHKKQAVEDKIEATKDKRMQYELSQMKPAQYRMIDEEKFQKLQKFITKIEPSFVGLIAAAVYLKPEKNIEFLEQLDKKYAPLYGENEFYKVLHEKVVAYAPIAIGKIAPEIMLPTPEGKTIRLTDYKGKYVLVDFWASWCAPCRKENPNVKRLYDKYKGKGFEVFSVSLDKNKDQWLEAIKEDKMNWVHVSDLLEYQSAAVQTYVISAIPSTFLLDKDGRIVAKNLRGKALENKLAELIK